MPTETQTVIVVKNQDNVQVEVTVQLEELIARLQAELEMVKAYGPASAITPDAARTMTTSGGRILSDRTGCR